MDGTGHPLGQRRRWQQGPPDERWLPTGTTAHPGHETGRAPVPTCRSPNCSRSLGTTKDAPDGSLDPFAGTGSTPERRRTLAESDQTRAILPRSPLQSAPEVRWPRPSPRPCCHRATDRSADRPTTTTGRRCRVLFKPTLSVKSRFEVASSATSPPHRSCWSFAVLLGRPHDMSNGTRRAETVNDADGFLANFWRALAHDPEAVAHWCDWPVNEVDLFARHLWLVNTGGPGCLRAWRPTWTSTTPRSPGGGCGASTRGSAPGGARGRAVGRHRRRHRQAPHLGDAGRGVNRKRPHLGDAGQGVNRQRPTSATPGRA